MTPKERLIAYKNGQEVDRIPTTLSANETSPVMYGYNISDYYFSVDIMVDVETRLANDFGADNMGIGLGLRGLVEALGTELEFPPQRVSYIKKPALNSLEEAGKLHPINIEKDGRIPIIIEAISRLQEKFGEERIIGSGLAGPFTTAASLIDLEAILKASIRNKEGLHFLLQRTTDIIVECCHDLYHKLGISFSISEPMGSKNLLSKKQFNEFCAPYIAQTVKRLNEFQGSTGLHICGKTHDRWQEIVDTGISSFWVDNTESLKELKKKFGSQVSISGNLPPVEILKYGTKDEIEQEVIECIIAGADNPSGFQLSPGCTTPELTPKENLIAFMNAAAMYGKFARKGQFPKGIKGYLVQNNN